MKTKLSFVIPCYGSENTITGVVDEIRDTVSLRADEYDYEIILVSDYSPDRVFSVITELSKNDSRIKGIELARNFGQHAALLAGFHQVTGDIIVCLDDDGQTPANQLFLLVDTLNEDCDVVYAGYEHKQHSLFRNFGSKMNDLMVRYLLDKPKDLQLMSYFACKRYILDEVIRYDSPYPYVAGLFLRATKNIKNVTVEHRSRPSGKSGYTIRKLFSLLINGFTSFSVKPLRLATLIGCTSAFVGFLYGLYIIVKKLLISEVPIGYSSLMAVFLFISGIMMIMLGIIGEYIGRIYISLNKAPQFVIRRTVHSDIEAERKQENKNG